MDHKTAERIMAVERYLLDEFSPEEKESFEEHFFSCQECAEQIQLGAAFMTQAKDVLQTTPVATPAAEKARKQKRPWFSWFTPVITVPAMALMLGVIAFQNLVQFPTMHQELVALNAPAILPSADLKAGISRGEEQIVSAKTGDVFQLTIDIADASSGAHTMELQDASGHGISTIAIPADAPKEGLA
jgi:hypothetical protein